MHDVYKSDDISCKNTFSVKMVRPSKVESHLEAVAYLHQGLTEPRPWLT